MNILNKYAQLLVNYCLELKSGQQVFISSTTLAEPLVREVYREAIKVGAHPEVNLSFEGISKIFLDNAAEHQLDYTSPISEKIISEFDAYLSIRAPFNLKEDANVDGTKRQRRSQANASINQLYSKRTAEGSLVRSLCQYPTNASAQEASAS